MFSLLGVQTTGGGGRRSSPCLAPTIIIISFAFLCRDPSKVLTNCALSGHFQFNLFLLGRYCFFSLLQPPDLTHDYFHILKCTNVPRCSCLYQSTRKRGGWQGLSSYPMLEDYVDFALASASCQELKFSTGLSSGLAGAPWRKHKDRMENKQTPHKNMFWKKLHRFINK